MIMCACCVQMWVCGVCVYVFGNANKTAGKKTYRTVSCVLFWLRKYRLFFVVDLAHLLRSIFIYMKRNEKKKNWWPIKSE